MKEINADGLIGYLDYLVAINKTIIMAGIFERSAYKTKALGAKFGTSKFSVRYKTYLTKSNIPYHVSYVRVPIGSGRDQFWYTQAVSGEIGKSYFVTTTEDLDEDFYNYLMRNYKLPLLKNWAHQILVEALEKRHIIMEYPEIVYGDCPKALKLHGKTVPIEDLRFFGIKLSEEALEEIVSFLLRTRKIFISKLPQSPLDFKDFNGYIQHYGGSLVKNLEKEIIPLCELNGQVETLALRHKRLYPQQAACVNGILALKKQGISYGIMNQSMGVGKTIQGMSVIEAYFVDKYKKNHPSLTLKDIYLNENVINYRAIIMSPGHLVEKWAAEIKAEIPYAKVTILKTFSQLLELRERGKERCNGREFYILSKDFCKLGSQMSPIPSQIKKRYVSVSICKNCFEERNIVFYKQGTGRDAHCPECKGTEFISHPLRQKKILGLVCPHCGELLTTSGQADKILRAFASGDENTVTLKPKDFAKKTTTNSVCKLCQTALWGVNSKPIDCGGEFSKWVNRPPKWRKISHFKNKKRKSRESAFVLRGHEDEYLISAGIKKDDFEYLSSDYGPRKSAPSTFIKKYLKGYFDFCILDEIHKCASSKLMMVM